MWWAIGYVAALIYAGSVFTLFATRDRWSAAIGTLMALSGAQIAVQHTLSPLVGYAIAGSGLALIAREGLVVVNERGAARLALAKAAARSAQSCPEQR